MELNLKGKVAIVTGATSGIGEAIAFAFADEGVNVVVVGRNEERGAAVVSSIEAKGSKAVFAKADLADESGCKQVVDFTLEKFGQIDILVNNAGVNDGVGLLASPGEFMASIRKNLFHYFAMLHFARQALVTSKGCVVNIGSKVANTGQGGTSGYAAAKGGIQALTREWAVELLPYGIRVNEVIPAETWTPLYDSWVHSFPDPEAKMKEITKIIPLGQRFTTCEEIADTVLFVASERASHITGQHLFVDGGYTHLDRSVGN